MKKALPQPKVKLKIINNIFTILVVVLVFLLYGFQLFNLKPYSVLSGSMESVYPTGSLIYVKKVDPAKLKEQDIITFKIKGGVITTHRIIELVSDKDDPDTIKFRTKGDENEIADGGLVSFDEVIGKPAFCIPLLGYLATFISQPVGRIVAIVAVISLLLIEIILGTLLEGTKPEVNE